MFSFPSWFQSRWSHFIRWRFGCCITENWSYWFSLLLMNHFCLFKQLHIPCSAQFSSALFYETSCICNSFKFLFLFFSLSGLCMLHVFLAGRCDVCYSWFSLKTYYRTDFTTGTTAECNKWIGKTGLCWHDSSHSNYLMDGTLIEMISGQYWCHSWFWYLIFFFFFKQKKNASTMGYSADWVAVFVLYLICRSSGASRLQNIRFIRIESWERWDCSNVKKKKRDTNL